jgi:hypothetical protein
MRRYLAYLTDCLTVHEAAEKAVGSLLRSAAGVAQASADRRAPAGNAVHQALQQLGPLSRSNALRHDLTALRAAYPSHVPAAAGAAARSHADALLAAARRRDSCHLLAHVFVLHLTQAASGMRFGAAAAEKLRLLESDAAQFYSAYPPEVVVRALDPRGSWGTGGGRRWVLPHCV